MSLSRHLSGLNFTDLLRLTITIYFKHFVTLAGISLVMGIPFLLFSIWELNNSMSGLSALVRRSGMGDLRLNAAGLTVDGLTLSVIGQVSFAFQMAANTAAISAFYLGKSITIKDAYLHAFRRWRTFMVLFLLLVVIVYIPIGILNSLGQVLGWLILVMSIVLVVATYIVLIHSLFVFQTIMLEHEDALHGLQRSWTLVRGSAWRIFRLFLDMEIVLLIVIVAPVLLIGIFFMTILPPLLAQFLLFSMYYISYAPLTAIVLTLLYYDVRGRKEGFDLRQFAQELDQTPPTSLSGTPA